MQIYEFDGRHIIVIDRVSDQIFNEFRQQFSYHTGRVVTVIDPTDVSFNDYNSATETCLTTRIAITREAYPEYLTLLAMLQAADKSLGTHTMTLHRQDHSKWLITLDGQFRMITRSS